MRPGTVITACALLAASLPLAAQPPAAAPPEGGAPYELGVFPFIAAPRIEKVFAPIAAQLSDALRRPVRYRSTRTYSQFMDNLERCLYDIAYAQPFDYVRIAYDAGYVPLVARKGILTAQLLVLSESPLRKVGELEGRVLGLPPAVAAVSYLSETILLDAGLVPHRDLELRHFRHHDACVQQLVIGNVDACATGPRTRVEQSERMGVRFRCLGESRRIPTPLVMVHERVPEAERERVKQALLAVTLPPEARSILNGEVSPFFEVDDADYESVREIWRKITANAARKE